MEEVRRAQKGLDFRFLFAYDSAAPILPSSKETSIMTIGQSMLSEFDQEMAGTRKTLERLPDQQWNWKPHDKSGTVGWLASPLATMPGGTTMTLPTDPLDYAPLAAPASLPPTFNT